MELDFGRIEFCGRDEELNQLQQTLRRARGDDAQGSLINTVFPQLVWLQGKEGTGRKTLVQSFVDTIKKKEIRTNFQPSLFDDDSSDDEDSVPSSSTSTAKRTTVIPLVGRGKVAATTATSMKLDNGDDDHSSFVSVGTDLPFAPISDCFNDILDQLIAKDPHFFEKIDVDH